MFSFNVKVYYEDTDAQGVVYYANYLKYFERTRTQWMLSCGVSLKELAETSNISFVVRNVNVHYLKPAKLEDDLIVTLVPIEMRKASMILAQNIYLKSTFNGVDNSKPMIESTVTLAAINLTSLKPVKLPDHLFSF